MKRWVTEVRATNPNNPNGLLVLWAGPNVPGETLADAEAYCQKNGLGYCKVVGLLIAEIPWSMGSVATLLYAPERDN